MIDIHIHILPGLDDGPATIEDALEMAFIAVKKGIRTVIATPHSMNGVYTNWREEILSACNEFNAELNYHKIPLEVLPGAEIRLCAEIVDELEKGRLMTLNDTGRYLSLELPEHLMLDPVFRFITLVRSRDIIPIIAHPERNMAIQNNISMLESFVEAGAMCQITGASIRGDFGAEAFDCCKKIVKMGLVHFMASDAHSIAGRPPDLKKPFKKLKSMAGKAAAKSMMFDAPEKVIKGIH